MRSAISGIVDDISGILKLALMTSEDFDGRLHTYAIGIKLPLGSKLASMKSNHQDGAKLPLDQTCKTCNPSVPNAEKVPGCRLYRDYQIAV